MTNAPPADLEALSARWLTALDAVGATGDGGPLFAKLVDHYSELGRHYHDLVHVQACLNELEAVRAECTRAAEVELALFAHDVIYDTHARDNEEQSAVWATEALAALGADSAATQRVAAMIRATAHTTHEAQTDDERIVVDVDLSILGQPPEVYASFEAAIRAEYAWVPAAAFRAGRRAVLTHFLEQPAIYRQPSLRRRYETQARHNLSAAIAALAQA